MRPTTPSVEAARAVGAYIATRRLTSGVCGICDQPLTTIGFHVGDHHVEVLSCGPCGWHTRQIDGRDATLEEVAGLLRGGDWAAGPGRGRLPGTWDRH